MLTLGTAGFLSATLVSASAANPTMLIAGRLAQGAAAALILPCVLAVLSANFEGEHRTRAISTWSAWSGLSVIVGPLLGGALVESTW